MARKSGTARGSKKKESLLHVRLDMLTQMVVQYWRRQGVNPSEKIRAYIRRHALPADLPAKDRVAYYTFLKRELAAELESRRKGIEDEYAREIAIIDQKLKAARG